MCFDISRFSEPDGSKVIAHFNSHPGKLKQGHHSMSLELNNKTSQYMMKGC